MALPVMAIMAAAQGAMGIGQKISAGAQRRQAEREFDDYEIPSGINRMLELLHGSASQTELPGSDIMRSRLASSTAEGVSVSQRTAKSSSDVLGALMGLYGKQMDVQQDMAVAGAQNYQRNQMQLAQGLQTLGNYQTQKWQYNELYPYMQKMTAAGEMDYAGGQNIGGAISSGINIFGSDMQMKHDMDMFGKYKEMKGLGGSGGQGFSPMQVPVTNTNRTWGSMWDNTKPVGLAPQSVDRYGEGFAAF